LLKFSVNYEKCIYKRFDEFFLQVVDYSSAKEYADQLGIPFLETSVRSRISFCILHLHHFTKIKVVKKSQNSRNQGFSNCFCMMMEGSGSGSGSVLACN
jgi:hypothetical protein